MLLPRTVRPRSPARYARLCDHVAAQLGDGLSVTALAAIFGKDPSGLARAPRARTGLAPYAWLTRCRMDEAARLVGREPRRLCECQQVRAAFRRWHGAPGRNGARRADAIDAIDPRRETLVG